MSKDRVVREDERSDEAMYELKTIGGFDFGEVSSAFQKAVRRGETDDALYWGVEMYLSGYGEYVWKRIRIIVSEDIGLAEPSMPANIHALYATYCDLKKKKSTGDRLMLVHAIMLISKARKHRGVDSAVIAHFRMHDDWKREIPDHALDKHTKRGRKKGRGTEHFFSEGAALANEASEIEDPYRSTAAWAAENKPAWKPSEEFKESEKTKTKQDSDNLLF